ncbi:MAG: hypothetical protein ACI9BG_000494 [Parasphingorhabdus sp.]|jgi:hypothetical protein
MIKPVLHRQRQEHSVDDNDGNGQHRFHRLSGYADYQ